MKNQSRSISYYLGSAYVFLAIISLTSSIPIRDVNCIALGALCFSLAELIQSLGKLRRRSRQPFCIDDFKALKGEVDSMDLASFYLTATIKEKVNVPKSSKIGIASVVFFYSVGFFVIIAWPYTKGMSILNHEKTGTFCTVFSLGIILLSRFLSELKEAREEMEYDMRFYDGLIYYVKSISETYNASSNVDANEDVQKDSIKLQVESKKRDKDENGKARVKGKRSKHKKR